jgi:hypothetical protein
MTTPFPICLATLILLLPASAARGQEVKAEVGVTTERQGVSLNVGVSFYHSRSRFMALGRLFINEPDASRVDRPPQTMTPTVEAAVGRSFLKGHVVVSPLAGLDSNKRVLVGGQLVAEVRSRTFSYLGYARIATDSDHVNGSRHRFLFSLTRNQRFILRLDWKTESDNHEHCRLGVEFHARIDKLNLPLFAEPFWNFPDKRIGIRVGTRL